jgi:Protein of unknown function (DUF3570)
MSSKKSNIAKRLTCAALALPGLVQIASAGRVEETYNSDFQYGNYAEDGGRMSVDIFEGALSAPIGKSMTTSVNLVRDVWAGASPVYNTRDAQGNMHQILSGASQAASTNGCGKSICGQRDAASAGLTYFFDKASISLGGGFSREVDYTSRYVNAAGSLDLNKKLTTLNFGASVAFDLVEPPPSIWSKRPADFSTHKTSQQYLLGITQVIDKDSLIQNNMTFGYHNGFLTDPYKQVDFRGTPIPEQRPKERFQWAWLTQYVRHFGQLNDAALHLDYRFSTDDWGVNAHTFEASWHQPIADGWQIIPRFRYYSEDKADFFQPTFEGSFFTDPNTGLFTANNFSAYSSDYRLAGFGTISGGIKLSKELIELKPFKQLKFQTGFEYFARKADYQLGGNNQGTFADYGYFLVTASFNLKI